jgi:hypothetical protein
MSYTDKANYWSCNRMLVDMHDGANLIAIAIEVFYCTIIPQYQILQFDMHRSVRFSHLYGGTPQYGRAKTWNDTERNRGQGCRRHMPHSDRNFSLWPKLTNQRLVSLSVWRPSFCHRRHHLGFFFPNEIYNRIIVCSDDINLTHECQSHTWLITAMGE